MRGAHVESMDSGYAYADIVFRIERQTETDQLATSRSGREIPDQTLKVATGECSPYPVAANNVCVADLRLVRPHVDRDDRLGAERARQLMSCRVIHGLFERYQFHTHQIPDVRVILRQLLNRSLAKAVGPTVSDVADHHVVITR